MILNMGTPDCESSALTARTIGIEVTLIFFYAWLYISTLDKVLQWFCWTSFSFIRSFGGQKSGYWLR